MIEYQPLGKYVALSQGLAINKASSHLISDVKTTDYPYPLLRISDMIEEKYSKYVSISVHKSCIASKSDIIYTRTGQIGLVFKGFEGVVHNNSFIVTIINDAIDKEYLFVALKSEFIRNQALNLAKNSVQPDLTHEMFKGMVLPVPNKDIQKKVAKIFSVLNKKITLNKNLISDLESLAKTIYDYWFLQFEFPNENGKPYKSSGGKMVWNKELKREIPDGWNVSPLRGKYQIERGISYSTSDIKDGIGIPMINLACVDTNRNYRDGELKYFSGKISPDVMLKSGDLLIACTDLTRSADIVGSPILVPDDGNSYTYSMDMAKISTTTKEFNELYLYMVLRTEFYHNYIKRWASGTNVLHLDLDGLNWYTTWIPPRELQDKYARLISTIHKEKSKILIENHELISLRDFLLPMLMNGQVSIKD